jgi:hypothetical protein
MQKIIGPLETQKLDKGYMLSKKQKCMSKSPMEAELIALMDNLGMIEFFRFITQKVVPAPVVYQDCCWSMMMRLISSSRFKPYAYIE